MEKSKNVSVPPSDKLSGRCPFDQFIAWIPFRENRGMAVYWRQYRGKEFIRWREFWLSKRYGKWYPDKRRAGCIPADSAVAMAEALEAGVKGLILTNIPVWLAESDRACAAKYARLKATGASPKKIQQAVRDFYRMPGDRSTEKRKPRKVKTA